MTSNTHWWIKWEPFFQVGAVLCIPIAILCASLLTAYYTEGSKLKLEYVRLAVNILQPPSKDSEPQQELREWAVQVLQDTAPVKLSPAAAKSLASGQAYFYESGSTSAYEYIQDYKYKDGNGSQGRVPVTPLPSTPSR